MLQSALYRWTRFVVRHAAAVLALFAIVTALASWVAVTRFSIDSNTSRLIRQDSTWRKQQDAFEAAFPEYQNLTFVVVSGKSITRVDATARRLEAALHHHDADFADIYAPQNSAAITDHALLYLDVKQLDTLVSRLAQAQPVLSAIRRQPDLAGALGVVDDALTHSDDVDPDGLQTMIRTLAEFAEDTARDSDASLSLRDSLVPADKTYYNIIFVQGRTSFDQTLPNARIMAAIHAAIGDLGLPADSKIKIRLTGRTPIEHGEIVSAMNSAQLAGSVAMILLIIVLVFGVRSLRVIGAIYLSLGVGLAWTAALATFTVGEFNTISIIFLVMFIGLGVDFAIHLALRYQENLVSMEKEPAIIDANVQMGSALLMCGLSSAIGFFAFVPTAYVGLAEMGIISGCGMILAIFISFTLVPAWFTVTRPPRPGSGMIMAERTADLLLVHRYGIAITTLVLALAAGWFARDVRFDFSQLALRDPNSEAMRTFRELQANDVITDYAMHFVAHNEAAARNMKARLLALPSVRDVKLPGDYLPARQTEKLAILGDAQFVLGDLFLPAGSASPDATERNDALAKLDSAISQYRAGGGDRELDAALDRLQAALSNLQQQGKLANFERHLTRDINGDIDWLQTQLTAGPLTLTALPQAMRDRFIDKKGEFLVSILPAGDMSDPAALKRFNRQVKGLVPAATGRAPMEIDVGRIVVHAFIQAIVIACIGIAILLYIALRSVADTVAVFIPLFLAALMTFATSVLIDLPLNMANVVVIPLIFGLGVDNGIHVVKRYREAVDFHDLVTSSTPRALLLSTLTTLGTFGALTLSSHRGIHSIGILLTCALVYQLILTLVVLPVLLQLMPGRRHARFNPGAAT